MLLFPAAILTISDESDRDFMKHLYINHAARMRGAGADGLQAGRGGRGWRSVRGADSQNFAAEDAGA